MPETPTAPTGKELASLPLEQAFEAYAPRFAEILPPDVPLALFKRVVLTALSENPDLFHADRRSLFTACMRAAADGVLPDGREAVLVAYRTKRKDREGRERYADVVQYQIMISGIRKRMRNSGEVLSATAEVVYQNDVYHEARGDDPKIVHEPAPLGRDRGKPIGAYAIIRLQNGEVLRDSMSIAKIELSRSQSKAPNSLMWSKFWDEGAKKTVLRRCAKGAPMDSRVRHLLEREEEPEELPPAEDLPLVPRRPRREDFLPSHDAETGEIAQTRIEQQDAPSPHGAGRAEDSPGAAEHAPPPHASKTANAKASEQVDEASERADFWKQKKFFVPKETGAKGYTDWARTQKRLLFWVNAAWTADELRQLRADSRITIDGLKLASDELWREVDLAIKQRLVDEFEPAGAAK